MIDKLKMEVLDATGEDLVNMDEDRIIIENYDAKTPLKPARLNLGQVKAQDDYDQSMRILIGENLKSPNGKGIDMWNSINAYRSAICSLVGTHVSADGENKYAYKAPVINKFENQTELISEVNKSFQSQNVHEADKETLRKNLFGLVQK